MRAILKIISQGQKHRTVVLPDYDLSEPGIVKVSIYGKIFDPAYSNLLIQNPDLALEDIIALDRVQKKLPLTDEMIKRLRNAQLIEGRKPNFHISLKVAKVTDKKVDYIKTKGFDDSYCKDLILEFIKKWGEISRKQAEDLLWDKLPDILDDKAKFVKVTNLLQSLRKEGTIALGKSKKWKLNL